MLMNISQRILVVFLLYVSHGSSLIVDRRTVFSEIAGGASLLVSSERDALTTSTTASPSGLGSRLAKRDPKELSNRIFNLPPPAQIYPGWMVGEWDVTSVFNGFVFPSRKVSKQQIIADYTVPGFQKCSIAATADVGKENVNYRFKILDHRLEDRVGNLKRSIDAYLGYPAVSQVLYDAKANPNRISIDFVDYKTINAERIELFCNARESEEYEIKNDDDQQTTRVFVCSEYARQVTFGTGQTVGVPRQVVTNYGLFWTWKQTQDGLQGNLLTAAYLDPQDALYFEEPTLPVVIYSHVFSAKPVAITAT